VARGRKLFATLPIPGDPATYSCSICHVPALKTAPPGTVINAGEFTVPAELGNKIIRPFSDFLLHDIGTGDGIVQNGPQEDTVPAHRSTRNKMRTPPLWGVRTRDRLMHDGESLTFLEAIERHKGEALSVTNRFMALPDELSGTCPSTIGCKEISSAFSNRCSVDNQRRPELRGSQLERDIIRGAHPSLGFLHLRDVTAESQE
jgi:Di-haem oxidoreductase, putative peroxidase